MYTERLRRPSEMEQSICGLSKDDNGDLYVCIYKGWAIVIWPFHRDLQSLVTYNFGNLYIQNCFTLYKNRHHMFYPGLLFNKTKTCNE
jgi:hypothetical protein